MARLLVENKADVNQSIESNGVFPLYVAAQNGHTNIVRLLISKQANINKINASGFLSLYVATENKETEVCNILKAHGASLRDRGIIIKSPYYANENTFFNKRKNSDSQIIYNNKKPYNGKSG